MIYALGPSDKHSLLAIIKDPKAMCKGKKKLKKKKL